MKPKTKVLIYNSNNDRLGLLVTRLLGSEKQYELHVLSQRTQCIVRHSRYCKQFAIEPQDISESERLEYIQDYIRKHNIEVLFPVSQPNIAFVSKYAGELEKITAVVPVPRPEMHKMVINKWSFSRFLELNQLPQPKTILISELEETESQLNQLSFPVLVKPAIDSGSGAGILKFQNKEELIAHLEKHPRIKHTHIIQNMHPGVCYGFNLLSNKGKILAYSQQKMVTDAMHNFGPPTGIKFYRDAQMYELCHRLIKTLGWSGLANIDMIWDEDQQTYRILEINARIWSSAMGSFNAGINFPAYAIKAALKEPFTLPEFHESYYSDIMHWVARRRGKITGKQVKFSETNWKFFAKDPLPFVKNLKDKIKR